MESDISREETERERRYAGEINDSLFMADRSSKEEKNETNRDQEEIKTKEKEAKP